MFRARSLLLALLLLVSVYLNVSLLNDVFNEFTSVQQSSSYDGSNASRNHTYTYIGTDYPHMLALERKMVAMVVEESVRYSLTDPESGIEWLWTSPLGDHHVRLGQQRRAFSIPMFHQLHCLRVIRKLIGGGGLQHFPEVGAHAHHCFVYLRQWMLCSADVTLEPGDFTRRNFTVDRVGATHTCQDWDPLYKMVNTNWREWEQYRDAVGLSEIAG